MKKLPDLVLNPGIARGTDSLVILPNGYLAKCSRGLQLQNEIIGNIYQIEESPNGGEQINFNCIQCRYLPICGGG